MSLTLSSDELSRLQAALEALLTPIGHPSEQPWVARFDEHLRSLLRADSAAYYQSPDSASHTAYSVQLTAEDLAEYDRWFWIDEGTARAINSGVEALTTTLLVGGDWDAYKHDPMMNEFYRPRGIVDAGGFVARLPDQSYTIYELHRAVFGTDLFGEKGLALLRLLLPAFKAGLLTELRLGRAAAELEQALDRLGQALLIMDMEGRILHQTPALTRLLAGDPTERPIREEIARMAVALGAALRHGSPPEQWAKAAFRPLRTGQARYDLRGSLIAAGVLGPSAVVAVAVERQTPEVLTDDDLHELFNLTQREIQVARLLAQGDPNAQIATALGISPHTAERHTERILQKLGIGSRAAVAHRLQRG